MKLLDALPDDGIGETWQWLTDVMVSSNATEQRVSNSTLPRRTFGMKYQFDDATELRRHVAAMLIGAKTNFQAPLYQYQTRLKAVAAIGATTVSILPARTELRPGQAALIFDRSGSQLVTVDSLTGASATFLEPLGRAYGLDASVCPVAIVYAGNNSALAFGCLDHDGKATLALRETIFLAPFLNPYNTAVVTSFNGLPVLTARPVGTEYNDTFDTGIAPTDEGGVISIRSPWTHAQVQLQRSFNCQRKFSPADWDLWRVFADTVRGSWKPFYMPTYRQDFAVVTPPAPSGTTVTFLGRAYADDWFPYAPFKAIAVFSNGGVHYASVTGVAIVGGNTVATFAPALPAGGAYALNQRVSLLQKVRIANDQVVCEHFSLTTKVSLTMRTVDA